MQHVGWAARTLLFGVLYLLGGVAWAAAPAGYWSYAGDTLWHFIPNPLFAEETHLQVGQPFQLLYTLRYYDRNGTKQWLTDASNISCTFNGLDLQHHIPPGTRVSVECSLDYVAQHYTGGGTGGVYVGEPPIANPGGFRPDGSLYPRWSWNTNPVVSVAAANKTIGRAKGTFTLPTSARDGELFCIRVTTAIHGTAAQEVRLAWHSAAVTGAATPTPTAVPPPPPRPATPGAALAGAWTHQGRPTSITQDTKGNLGFVNEVGQRSTGKFVSATTIVATEWQNGLRGSIEDSGRAIRWSNGTVWYRSGGRAPPTQDAAPRRGQEQGIVSLPPAASQPARPAAVEEILNTFNSGGVANGPTSPATLTLSRPFTITMVQTYHWNGANGAPGGSIRLQDSQGRSFGPWGVTTSDGSGAANVFWTATPGVVVPTGTYRVIDSDPGTWSQNPASGGRGFVLVQGYPAR